MSIKVTTPPATTTEGGDNTPAEPSEFMKALEARIGLPEHSEPAPKSEENVDEPPVDNDDQPPTGDKKPAASTDGKPSGGADEQAERIAKLERELTELKAKPTEKKEESKEPVKDPKDINSYSDEEIKGAIAEYKKLGEQLPNADELIQAAQEVLNTRAGKRGAKEVLDADAASKKWVADRAAADQRSAQEFGDYITVEQDGKRLIDGNSELFKAAATLYNASKALQGRADGGYQAMKLAFADLVVAGKLEVRKSPAKAEGTTSKPNASGSRPAPPLMKSKPSASSSSTPPSEKDEREKKVKVHLERHSKDRSSDGLHEAIKARITGG